MTGGSSSSSLSKSPSSPGDDRLLLKFYQKKFEECQRKDDSYKEKIDKHLKNLVSDRHELEQEVTRRGEKISNLQKALVELQLSVFEERERFLKVSAENEMLKGREVQLHENMRQLLSMTHQKDLRDKIIYIMKDPTIEIGYRKDFPSKSKSTNGDLAVSQKLREEIDYLKNQMDEMLKVSKRKSHVVLEDCKQALEKSKEKIMQDDFLIRELQKKLQDLNVQQKENASPNTKAAEIELSRLNSFVDDQLSKHKSAESYFSQHASSDEDEHSSDRPTTKTEFFKPTSPAEVGLFRQILSPEDPLSRHIPTVKSQYSRHIVSVRNDFNHKLSGEDEFSREGASTESQVTKQNSDSESSKTISSHLKDIHLSLILFMRVVSKINSILSDIQATKVYQRTAKIPRIPSCAQYYVEDGTIIQLETYLRQCTRLTYDINNMHKTLTKHILYNKTKIQNVEALQAELKYLEDLIKELTISTADTDLVNIDLKRSDFYSVLKGAISSKDGSVQNLSDFQKIISNCDSLTKAVSKTIDFVEDIIQINRSNSHLPKVQDYLKRCASVSLESQKEALNDLPKRSASTPIPTKQSETTSSAELENLLRIYKRAMNEAENLGLSCSPDTKILSEKLLAIQRKLKPEEKVRLNDNYLDDNMKDEMSQTHPNQKRSMMSQTDRKLKQSEMSQTDPKWKTGIDYYKDYAMRDEISQTVSTVKKSGISQTIPSLKKSGMSQTIPSLKKSGISQTDPKLKKSEISQTDPKWKTLDDFYKDMRNEISQTDPKWKTLNDFYKDMRNEISQTDPQLRKTGISQTDPMKKISEMSQTDPKLRKSYTDFIMLDNISQTDPKLKKSEMSQTDPKLKKSYKDFIMLDEISQTDPKLKKSETSQTDPKLRKSYKDFIMLDEISQTDPKLKMSVRSETEPKLSRSNDIIRQISKTHSKVVENNDYFRGITRDEASETDPKFSSSDDILRKINKTLFKVNQMEDGAYFKDEELYLKLDANVKELNRKFKELTEEFNLKSVQDQFSEYSTMTLGKLEELAKQSRDIVIAAEAQIGAHRSSAKDLSKRLKETEELLRDSVNECLSLRRKLQRAEQQREWDKYTFLSGIRENLKKRSQKDEVETAVNELIDELAEDNRTSEVARPFVCIYCQQGTGHKLCQEKIRELRAEERKTKTLLKLLQQDMKQEKEMQKEYKELAGKTSSELVTQNNTLKETVQSLEKNNAVLLEKLKVEKNRVKNMERFRRLEVEGFQTDIKNLKSKIRDMEKQLLKAVLMFEEGNKDMELLKKVHETAQHSKEATTSIRRLKAKLYELENDIKHL